MLLIEHVYYARLANIFICLCGQPSISCGGQLYLVVSHDLSSNAGINAHILVIPYNRRFAVVRIIVLGSFPGMSSMLSFILYSSYRFKTLF